jgi:methionine-rich copper-binding protein CopC
MVMLMKSTNGTQAAPVRAMQLALAFERWNARRRRRKHCAASRKQNATPRMKFALLAAFVALWPGLSAARSVHVRESRPVAETVIRGRHAEYVIRFDGPVDHAASRMQITQSGRVIQSLTPLMDSAVDVLFASGETPPPGRYALHWEAKSADGDFSNGDIPFDVAP